MEGIQLSMTWNGEIGRSEDFIVNNSCDENKIKNLQSIPYRPRPPKTDQSSLIENTLEYTAAL